MSRRLLLLLALTCASAVGNLYFPQALTPLIGAGFGSSSGTAALVVPATQLGYTAGMLLLVPLSDRFPARPLLVTLLGVTGLALTAAGCAPTLPALIAGSAVIGLMTVSGQVVGTLATRLVPTDQHGAVLGALLSGSTAGMLLTRVGAGALGRDISWRVPYLVAGAVSIGLAVVLRYALPGRPAATRQPYPALVTEALRLLRDEPDLRRSCFYQATVFGGFSAVWTCLTLLVGGSTAGALALVGAVTMVCVPVAGRQVDRHGTDRVTLVCLIGVLVAAAVLAAGNLDGRTGLVAVLVGTLLLDVAMQCGMVANSTRIHALRADVRGRLSTAYMTCAYLGGTLGSLLGVKAWEQAGWSGVCGLLAASSTLALGRHLAHLTGITRSAWLPAAGRAARGVGLTG